MTNQELTAYMGGAVERLVKGAMKTTITNPQAAMFFVQAGKHISRAKEKRNAYEEKGVHIPTFLISSITKSCNLFCTGCYARANGSCGEKQQGTMLTEQEWERIFKEASELGISFHLLAGGEPLLRKDVIQKAACQKDTIFPIFTNGTLINDKYRKMFAKNRNLIPVISMEGLEKETDDRRGAGVYKQVIEILGKLQKEKLFYGVSVTVTRENLSLVTGREFMDVLKDLGCKLVFFIEYVPVEEGTKHLAFTDADREELEKQQEALRKAYEEMLFLSFPGDEKYMGGCLAAGRGFFHINADGEAEACPFSPYSDRSLKQYSLVEVLDSPLFRKLQNEHLVGGEHTGGCALFEQEEKVRAML